MRNVMTWAAAVAAGAGCACGQIGQTDLLFEIYVDESGVADFSMNAMSSENINSVEVLLNPDDGFQNIPANSDGNFDFSFLEPGETLNFAELLSAVPSDATADVRFTDSNNDVSVYRFDIGAAFAATPFSALPGRASNLMISDGTMGPPELTWTAPGDTGDGLLVQINEDLPGGAEAVFLSDPMLAAEFETDSIAASATSLDLSFLGLGEVEAEVTYFTRQPSIGSTLLSGPGVDLGVELFGVFNVAETSGRIVAPTPGAAALLVGGVLAIAHRRGTR